MNVGKIKEAKIVADAIFHATGKNVRDLTVTLDKLFHNFRKNAPFRRRPLHPSFLNTVREHQPNQEKIFSPYRVFLTARMPSDFDSVAGTGKI
jgi:hypothetical protein